MAKKFSPFVALQSRDYRLFLFGSFISGMGSQMQIVAVSWQVYELTNSATSLAWIGVSGLVPVLLFSIIGGMVADKFDRKKLLILGQLLMGLAAIVLAITTQMHIVNQWLIYSMLALTAAVTAFAMPARQAVIPALVPKEYFMNAISLNTLQRQAATMIGPAIGGLMIAAWGVQGIYTFNALSFLVMVLTIFPLSIPVHDEEKKADFSWRSLKDGIKFVKSSQILYTTMFLDFLASFFGSATILMPVFAKDVLHVGPQGLGLLYAAPSVGGVVAGIVLSSIHRIHHQGKVILVSVILYGLATIGFGLSTTMPLSLFFLALTGAGDMVSTIVRNTIRQVVTPDHLRGRMVGINMVFVQGGPQLGDIEAGILASLIGAGPSVAIGGIGTVAIASLLALTMKKLRRYNGAELAV